MALPIDFHENFKEMVLPETTMPRDLAKTSRTLSSLFKLWPLSQTLLHPWVIILPFTQTFLCFMTQFVTLNLEIFARVLFSQNFAYAKFREKKSSRRGEITLSFSDTSDTHMINQPLSRIFSVANMCYNAISENKLSEYTVNDLVVSLW